MYAVIEIEDEAGGIPRSCRLWTKREDALESAVEMVLEGEDCHVTEENIRDHINAYGYKTVGGWTVWLICADEVDGRTTKLKVG